METFFILLTVFVGSALTLVSGFGLGTLLMPVMAIFFPIDVAILLTAWVHLANNLIKFGFYYKNISWPIIIRFAPTAIIGAWMGSTVLGQLNNWNTPVEFSTLGIETTTFKISLGSLLGIFAIIEWMPQSKRISFSKKWLPLGGWISGFFGGLSGHQGALRSAFLIRAELTKEVLIGTGIVIATCIDITRISQYIGQHNNHVLMSNASLFLGAVVSAFLGVYLTQQWIQKVTIQWLQKSIALLLIIFSICLMLGWI
ncbi:MAG: hypothetical protein RL106_1828 [Bacteroidota bacterium]|jgi:uncharacterized membrane protein YfcA